MLTSITIDRVEPFADGREFGVTGAYERVVGRASGEIDPEDPRNAVIAGIDKAPLNALGRVEYDTDLYLLRPKDLSRGNGTLLYEVNNRGRKMILPWLNESPADAATPGGINDPSTVAHAGTGFVFRHGLTLVWCGWDPDAPSTVNGLSIRVPVATEAGRPIVRMIREELVSGARSPASATFRLSYASDTTDTSRARLTYRHFERDERRPLAPGDWAFENDRTIALTARDHDKPRPGWLYEIHYPAKNPKIIGIGLAATRDFISFLRNGGTDTEGAPTLGQQRYTHALAIGISQGGRYLRDHIAFGFNQDERGGKVFDGVFSHVAGIGRVFLNELFAQPWRTSSRHQDHLFPEGYFPFAAAPTTDPVSGSTASLLRGDGFDPLLIETNTPTEYWQKGASLLHTDPTGQLDLDDVSSARLFLIAGTQHGGRGGGTTDRGSNRHMKNPHSAAPAIRALLLALDRWVKTGTPPPANRVPRLKDGTLVPAEKLGFPGIPGVVAPPEAHRVPVLTDWVEPTVKTETAYRPLVPALDTDGNDQTGLLLPEIAVPLATYTGWNLYAPPMPDGEIADRDGSFFPFPKTRAERETAGDPRPSLVERYGTADGYRARLKAAADALIQQGLLQPEDAQAILDRAAAVDF